MTQFAVRIGSMLLICVAATPVVAGPRAERPSGAVAFTLVVVEARLRPRTLQPLTS